jgi:alkylated DNA repair protein (DNA oxidative demethylase)
LAEFLETADLFGTAPDWQRLEFAPGAMLLRGFALDVAPALLRAKDDIAQCAPFRHLITPGGYRMSVAMTCSGSVGWVSEPRGYRYSPVDPVSGKPWPPLPSVFLDLAVRAAQAVGHADFRPDCCLLNRYAPGARLTLHQDRDEQDLCAPIVSVSLGLPARFLFGGIRRSEPVQRLPLLHGDVVVWGGPARLAYHGVAPVAAGEHSATGAWRFNLTFRTTR